MIYLASFKESKKLAIPCYAASVYQPAGFSLPEAECFKVTTEVGSWIRPRLFTDFPGNPLQWYRRQLLGLYATRHQQVLEFLDRAVFDIEDDDKSFALCCWCPHKVAAQRQLKEFGMFVCHMAAIYEYLELIGKDVTLLKDREKMVKLWKLNR